MGHTGRRRFSRSLILVAAAGVAVAGAGCGDDGGGAPDPAPSPATFTQVGPVAPEPPRTVEGVRIPEWVVLYAGSGDPSGYFPMGKGAEAFRYETDDAPGVVVRKYGGQLTKAGYTVAFVRTPNQGANHGALTANFADPPRNMRINVIARDGGGSTLAYQIEAQ